jgi:hypothetical protein
MQHRTVRANKRSVTHEVKGRGKVVAAMFANKIAAQEIRPIMERKVRALLSVPGKDRANIERNTRLILECFGLIDGRKKNVSQAAKLVGISRQLAVSIIRKNVQRMMQDPKIRNAIGHHYTKEEIMSLAGRVPLTSSNELYYS